MYYVSRIATIVYENYTENVDMNNDYFKQSELDSLVKSDKSIVRVDYYIDGELIGNKVYSDKQAIAQVLKMNTTIGKIYGEFEGEYGDNWFACKERNEKRTQKIHSLYDRIAFYKNFITEEGYNKSGLGCDLCQDFKEFMS